MVYASKHIFCFVLIDLLKGYKNHKNIYSPNTLYGNKMLVWVL